MPPEAEPVEGRLEHIFQSGLRFDKDLLFRTQGKRRSTWSKVPSALGSDRPSHVLIPLMQACLVLQKARLTHAQLKGVALGRHDTATPQQLLEALADLPRNIVGRCIDVADLWEAFSGHGCATFLVGLQPDLEGRLRWAWVTGVERERSCQSITARSLLSLDPSLPPPWGTGFNARLQPSRAHGQPSFVGNQPWQCSGLDGQVETVILRACIELTQG